MAEILHLAELQLLVAVAAVTNMMAQEVQQVLTDYRGAVAAVVVAVGRAHIKADSEEMPAKFQHRELKGMEIPVVREVNQFLGKQVAVAVAQDHRANHH